MKQKTFLETAIKEHGEAAVLTKGELTLVAKKAGTGFPYWMTNPKLMGDMTKVSKGMYKIPSLLGELKKPEIELTKVPEVVESKSTESTLDMSTYFNPAELVPKKDELFVPHGHFSDLIKVLSSRKFYPVFETGESGTGKTYMTEQACAKLKREFIRVNITIETDEDDLMGGHTLVGGDITFREGPVIKAMRKGAVLLLDEVDLGSNKLMCLQSVLEGKGYFIKKTGEWVSPKEGFTVLATANTKGQGSDDGKFIGTQIMNEAMLERFAITMQQEYPPVTTERSILKKEMELTGLVDNEFCEKLVDWADIIRKSYYEGAIDDVVTTRRLVHIVNAFRMFGDKLKSITMCISRFDEETRNSILDLYTKIDAGVDLNAENPIDEMED